MNVYVVTSGEYSDYRINGMFSTEVKAQEFIEVNKEKRKKHSSYYYDDFNDIEEYELDCSDKYFPLINQGYEYYYVAMEKDGNSNVNEHYIFHFHESFEIIKPTYKPGLKSFLQCYLWAKSPEHAVKIANEKRAQLIANGEWDE